MNHTPTTSALVLYGAALIGACAADASQTSDAPQGAGPLQPSSEASARRQELVDSLNGLRTVNGLTATNGLVAVNGLSTTNGLRTRNGLMVLNGLKTLNGLRTRNGLSVDCTGGTLGVTCVGTPDGLLSSETGLMSNDDGIMTAKYLVRCALPATEAVTVTDYTGALVTLTGEIGFAPEWAEGECDEACQEKVSACLMALTNTAGTHVQIGLAAPFTVGTGTDADLPFQEAAYYGNLFVSPPQAFYAEGAAFQGKVGGASLIGGTANRSCGGWLDSEASCPYTDMGTMALAPSDAASVVSNKCATTADGTATSCVSGAAAGAKTWAYPITTYRDLAGLTTATKLPVAALEPGVVSLAVGRSVSIEPGSRGGYLVRHQYGTARVDRLDASSGDARNDATFTVRGGLATSAGVSLEAVNVPGSFLKLEGGAVVLRSNDGTASFADEATFLPFVGLTGQFTSFVPVSNPSLYLRVSGASLYAQPADGTDQFRRDATFAVRAGVLGLVSPFPVATNLAPSAALATSFVSTWESLGAVANNVTPASSADHATGAYGNWNGSSSFGKTNWVSFTWPAARVVTGLEVYWWNDSAGIATPDASTLEYLDSASIWRPLTAVGTTLNAFNRLEFVPITTKSLRLSMSSPLATGVIEARVLGFGGAVNIAPSATLATSYVSPWESLAAINNGVEPANSADHTTGAYGNWQGEDKFGRTDWVSLTWPTMKTVTAVEVYWWDDDLGIAAPREATVEYLDSASTWRSAGGIGTVLNRYNRLTLSVPARAVRISMRGVRATGIVEARVMALSP